MKKHNFAKIFVLLLSLALLVSSAFVITAAAEGETLSSKGEFGDITVAYGENIAICVAVDATADEITNGTVKVEYTIGDKTANATYLETDENDTVWVMTEGIAIYNITETVSFSSYVNETKVESDRTYSVARFLYSMLYKGKDIDESDRAFYESLMAYANAAQIKFGINTDKPLDACTMVYTENDGISLDGSKTLFTTDSAVEVTPVWNGEIDALKEHIGWSVKIDGADTATNFEALTFTASGVVEIVEPIFKDKDVSAFTLANGGFEEGLEGWTLVGNIGDVSSDSAYWTDQNDGNGYAFGKDGENMFSAYAPGALESAVGTLTSSTFTVGGSGFVTFKLGAMKDGNYVYVDVVDAETHKILARYYNGLWDQNLEGDKRGCTLIAYKADLSAFMGKDVYFRISDNANAEYGLFFVDSFNTYYAAEPEGFNAATPVNYAVSGTIYDVFNGGFELGDVQGWWNDGEIGLVTNANGYWQDNIPYGKDGDFLFTGVESFGADTMREGNRGALTSSVFQIGGTGFISFKLGGGDNALCYVQVIDSTTGEVLARYHQQAQDGAKLIQYVADLSAYIGRSVRVQVVDQADGGWGCVSFDSVVTYYPEGKALPEGITANDIKGDLKYTIDNGSFETGKLDGWTMNITEAGKHNTLGWVQNTEIDAPSWYTKNDGIKDGEWLFTFATPDDVNCESSKGTLVSSTFSLKQGAFVSFKFGGAGGGINHDVYIELCRADGSVIARFYNDAEGKVNTRMNAYFYQYGGPEVNCFFRVVDNSTSDYGCFVVDDFRVNLESAPEGFIGAIQ